MTKQKLVEKIKAAGDIYGTFENITIIESAFPSCNPSNDAEWSATGFVLNGDELRQVQILWDFSTVPECKGINDASIFPWDDQALMSIGNEVDNYDLTDDDDIDRASSRIEK